MMQKNPQDFERQLKLEADVAEATGRADVFQINIEHYKQAAAGRPDLAAAARRFETSATYQAIVVRDPGGAVPNNMVKYLIESPSVIIPQADQETLLDVMRNSQLAPATRRSAIRALMDAPAFAGDVQSKYLESLRTWSNAPDSDLFGAATTALAIKGTVADQQNVALVFKNSSPSTTIKAIGSFEGKLSATTERAVTEVVTTTQDADVKVTSLRALKGTSDPQTIRVVAKQTADTETAAVRMEAVAVLSAAPSTPERTKTLTDVAKNDKSADVRAAAQAALVIKKENNRER